MKKFISILLATALAVSVTACGGNEPSSVSETSTPSESSSTSEATTPQTEMLRIGVVQLVEHAALDATYLGFVDGLKEAGFEDGKNITIDFQNAQGEQSNCVTIADKLVNDQSDLILAIATPAAQAVANRTKDIPVLATAVTDFASAKLVVANDAPGGNVSGTSDLNPIEQQMDLLKQIVPDAKKVAILYSSSETNSEFQANLAKETLAAMGIEGIDATVSNANELQQVIQSLDGKVDAIYTPTDNVISSSMALVSMTATGIGLPVIVGEPEQVKNGGTATFGLSYYNLGKQTANMAVRILNGESKPADMPVEFLKETELFINQTNVDALQLAIPQELLDKAQIVTNDK